MCSLPKYLKKTKTTNVEQRQGMISHLHSNISVFASALILIIPRKISLVKYIPVEICHVGLSSLVLFFFLLSHFFRILSRFFF